MHKNYHQNSSIIHISENNQTYTNLRQKTANQAFKLSLEPEFLALSNGKHGAGLIPLKNDCACDFHLFVPIPSTPIMNCCPGRWEIGGTGHRVQRALIAVVNQLRQRVVPLVLCWPAKPTNWR